MSEVFLNGIYSFFIGSEEENLLTMQKLFRMPTKPVITSYYTNIFQNIGSDVVLPCRVDSVSKSQVFWQDNNDELVFGNPRMRVWRKKPIIYKQKCVFDQFFNICGLKYAKIIPK